MIKQSHLSFILFLFTLVLFSPLGSAQEEEMPENIQFEIFEMPGGILGNHCQAIAQDSVGFMWFGTQYGLHRWDGNQFKTYYHRPHDSSSLSSSYIESIYVAKDGTLWLGTWGGGLNHFDLSSGKFTRYLHEINNEHSISSNYVSEILEDDQGFLWVATQDGVNRLNLQTQQFKRFYHNPEDPRSLSYNVCRTICKDRNGVLWFGTGWPWEEGKKGGLNRYHPETENFTSYTSDPEDLTSLKNHKIFEIFEDSRNNFWVGTMGDGLYLMDRKTGSFTPFERINTKSKISPKNLYGLDLRVTYTDHHTKFVFEDSQSKIWIGEWLGGLKYYDPETGTIRHFYYDGQGGKHTIPNNYLWQMFQSKDGTLWGCTAGPDAKVFKIKKKRKLFGALRNPCQDIYNAYCESSNGDQWFSGKSAGLIKVDAITKDTFQYLADPRSPKPNYSFLSQTFTYERLPFQSIFKIVEDQNGNLWLGKNDHVEGSYILMQFDPARGNLRTYKHDPDDGNSIGHGMFMDMLVDEKGKVWVTTESGEINLYRPEKDNFQRFSFVNDREIEKGFPLYIFSALTNSKKGNIFIGHSSWNASDKSIYLDEFDPDLNQFVSKTIVLPPDKVGGIPQGVNGIEEDEAGNIWVSTMYRLHKVNPLNRTVKNFDVSSFNLSYISSFKFDDRGQIWFASEGLVVYDPKNGSVYRYGADEGIFNLPSGNMSVHQRSDGLMIVGGRSGYIYFYPDEIEQSAPSAQSEILISDFQLLTKKGNEAFPSDSIIPIWSQNKLRLKYNQNVFSIRFALLDFLEPESNQYEFILDNYDLDWRVTSAANPVATYVKVPPGEYALRVRGSSAMGASSEEASIKIIITPPWWQTWWAQSLFYTLLGLLLYGIYRFQLSRKLEHAEATRIKDLDALKTQLYTNITHEFRTPLTVISGMADQIQDNPKEWFREGLTMIKRNSLRLLNLVNQMLDLSKLESGKMVLQPIQSDIISYINYLKESFKSYAEKQNIQLHFHSEVKVLTMDYDPEKLQQVVSNLLSNAIKFTPAGGHVYIQIRKESSNKLVMKVRDTGIGIPEDQLVHIFDRFYQVDDSMTRQREGSGVGLALTHQLIKLMDGEIKVESDPGSGTEFTVALPVHNHAEIVEPILTERIKSTSNLQLNQSENNKRTNGSKPNLVNAKKINLLLIEDNPDVVAYIASCLPSEFHILVGNDGQEGIDIALESIPDLIISDVMMPLKDGFEVCDTLKRDERTSHIPIIMLTAKADMESKLEGLEQGADAYLAKPFHKAELLVRIKKLLELRQTLQRHYCALAGSSTATATSQKDSPELDAIENTFIKKARSIVESHLDDFDFNVEHFCREISLSRSQLHRKLSALTGLSANNFIRYIRLNKAKALLQNPELTITAVAFDTGFNDPSYFGRVFKKEFDMTPKEWQDRVVEM